MYYAARINSFLSSVSDSVPAAIEQVSKISAATHVDLNYPEHFEKSSSQLIKDALQKSGLKLNALNMRFRNTFIHGVYTNPSLAMREQAVELTRQAARVCKELDGNLIIIWLSYDGYDYSMQMDYLTAWKQLTEILRMICQEDTINFAIEYKPYEERGYAILDSYGTTWNLIRDVGVKNLGVVLDFCHMLMKRENPAFAASLLLEQGKLYGIHLNDGEGNNDNGFMMGMCNPWKTIELLYYLKKFDYQGVVYFDTFPVREDAKEEFISNIEMFEQIWRLLDEKTMMAIANASKQQDGIAVQRILRGFMVGASDS